MTTVMLNIAQDALLHDILKSVDDLVFSGLMPDLTKSRSLPGNSISPRISR